MRVARTIDRIRGTSAIEPALKEDWPELKRLEWKAAVVMHDADLRSDSIAISEADMTSNGEPVPGMFAVAIGRSSWSPMSFGQVWDFLNGITAGIELARR